MAHWFQSKVDWLKDRNDMAQGPGKGQLFTYGGYGAEKDKERARKRDIHFQVMTPEINLAAHIATELIGG